MPLDGVEHGSRQVLDQALCVEKWCANAPHKNTWWGQETEPHDVARSHQIFTFLIRIAQFVIQVKNCTKRSITAILAITWRQPGATWMVRAYRMWNLGAQLSSTEQI